MTTTARIRAERLLPTAVFENWTAQRFAREVRCNKATSAKILGTTLGLVRRESERQIVGFPHSASRTLERAAARQIERLEALNAKADAEWTRQDFALERQSVAILR